MQLQQRRQFLGPDVPMSDDHEVAVAPGREVTDREGALQIGAQEVVAETRLGAFDQVGENAVELGVGRGMDHGMCPNATRARSPRAAGL